MDKLAPSASRTSCSAEPEALEVYVEARPRHQFRRLLDTFDFKPALKPQHLPALTGVRFVLAFWVVLHHLTGKGMMLDGWMNSLPAPGQSILRNGYLAVGVFFVLSGFVLARSYGSTNWNRVTLWKFGMGRIARIYPAYLLSLVIVSPFMVSFLFSPQRGSIWQKGAVLANYGFVLQGWGHAPVVNWNTPAWSLSCEFFFYLCFPLLAMVLRGKRALLIAVVVALVISPVLTAEGVPNSWKPLQHFGDFLLGIAAAAAYDGIVRSGTAWARRGAWFYAPAFLMATAIVAFPHIVPHGITLTGALRPLNPILILGLALGGGLPARLLSTEACTYLGKASYSLYIIHIPLLWWFRCSGLGRYRLSAAWRRGPHLCGIGADSFGTGAGMGGGAGE